MKALILYDDFASAAKANETLRRIAARPGIRVRWTIKCWQVTILKEANPFEQALADATDARLVLFAGWRAHFTPPWIYDWLKRWAARREIRDAGMAVIGEGSGLKLPRQSDLSQFAHQLSIDFITGGEPARAFQSRYGK